MADPQNRSRSFEVRLGRSLADLAAQTERRERQRRVLRASMLMLSVLAAGTFGYHFLTEEAYTVLDCLYMTVITVSTVGYSEVVITSSESLKVFTMSLILLGGGSIVYFLGAVTAIVVEGDLLNRLYRQRVAARLDRQRRHVIVAGLGRTGRSALGELGRAGARVVVIDQDISHIEDAVAEHGQHLLFIHGDALDEKTLQTARIDRAMGLLSTLSDDQENLFLCLTARQLSPDLHIVARVEDAANVPKFVKIGATDAVSSAYTAGRRLVHELLRPGLVAFTDAMLASRAERHALAEIPIAVGSKLAGQRLVDAHLDEKTDALVMGIRETPDAPYRYHPDPGAALVPGGSLMALGSRRKLRRLRRRLSGPGALAAVARLLVRRKRSEIREHDGEER